MAAVLAGIQFMSSGAAYAQYPAGSPVAINGKLKIVGNQLSNECGNPVQLRGMSTHGPQWFQNCYTTASLDALVNDWGIDVYRIAMYVEEGGYVNNPTYWKNWIDTMVEECAKRGVYCLIDWHVLNPGDPNANITAAREFWTYMSAKHSGKKHVLYEIANEPNGVTWDRVKTYANDIIPRIRANDPSTVVIVGTPTWSQDVDVAANSPLNYSNLMYALHFYSGTHTQWLRDKANTALAKGLALYVTEFGTSQASGDGGPYLEETQRWIDWMASNKISWANWSFADKAEVSASLSPGACAGGNWNTTTQSGAFIKQRILSPADNFNCSSTTSYTITASAGTGGTITPSGNVSVSAGANRTFTIAASSGYEIAAVTVNGSSVGAVASYTFTNVQRNHTIAASFRQVTSSTQTPWTGTAYAVPGRIEAENFDKGGQGVAYSDTDAANNGSQYRTSEAVDIETSTEGDYNVGWTQAGEWLEYTVNVATAGDYKVDVRVASANSAGGSFSLEFDGVNKTGTTTAPGTGGWQNWTTVSKTVSLSAGKQVMRLSIVTGGFNINYLSFTQASTTPTNLLANGGFESGTTPWTGNSSTISQNTSQKRSGTYSLRVTGRSASWAGPVQNIRSVLASNGPGAYDISAWMRKESGTGTGKVTIMLRYGGVSYYVGVTGAFNSTSWSQVAGTVNLSWTGTLEDATIYVETVGNQDNFFVDDASLLKGSNLRTTSAADVSDHQAASSLEVRTFPNPAANKVAVQLSGKWEPEVTIALYNRDGKLLSREKLKGDAFTLDLSDKPAGLYILQVYDKNNRNVHKLLKQ
jgi:aryl-phospho-beta-D-glucosidase BglC (GH1 family)